MSDNTKISWADATWNPIVGCSIKSAGCTNCYAMKMVHRLNRMKPSSGYECLTETVKGKPVWTGAFRAASSAVLNAPFKWKRPRNIFVCSLSDLFHEDIPDICRDIIFTIMALTPHHRYLILTKRPIVMREYLTPGRAHTVGMKALEFVLAWHHKNPKSTMGAGIELTGDIAFLKNWPLPNVSLGVSVENQSTADERIPDLLATPAAKRFVSCEPMLGKIDLTLRNTYGMLTMNTLSGVNRVAGCGSESSYSSSHSPKLDWVICGGESGPGHRPMNMKWAEALMGQCREAATPFFFKQDSAPRPGLQGRASNELWACKEVIE